MAGLINNPTGQRLKALLLFAVIVVALPLAGAPAQASPGHTVASQQRIYLNGMAPFLNVEPAPQRVDIVVDQYLQQSQHWITTRAQDDPFSLRHPFSWQKIDLHNPTSQPQALFLVCAEPAAERVVATLVKEGRIAHQWHTGSDTPRAQRPLQHRYFIVPFSIGAGETVTLVVGSPNNMMRQMLWIEEPAEFWRKDAEKLLADGMYLGTIGVLSLLVLILYLVHRNTTYLFFYGFVFFCGIHNLFREGYLQQFLPFDIAGFSRNGALTSIILLFMFFVLFAVRFLEFGDRHRAVMRWFSRGYPALNAVVILLIFLTPTGFHIPTTVAAASLSVLLLVLLWVYSLNHSCRGHYRSRLFVFASLFYIVPLAATLVYISAHPLEHLPVWISPRNGDTLLSIALYFILLYELRRDQIEKQAALLEAEARANFFATLSHELRTPLNGVIGMAELLHQTEQTPTQRQYSDIIISSGKVLLSLINDILDFSKITDDKLELENNPYELHQLLTECVVSFVPTMLKKVVPIYVHYQPDIPFHFFGDQYRIRQIIYNLISNAMKFTERGQVLVKVSAQLTADADTWRVRISVIDTGVGIPRDAQDKIFQQFSQADASTTRRFGGSGLGLAICKAIVEQMQGSISVDSQPGRGSTFTVEFPTRVDTLAEQERRQTLSTLAGKRLLVLTSHPDFLHDLITHLRHWGVDIEEINGNDPPSPPEHTRQYDAILVFYPLDAWQKLAAFIPLKLPILVLHYTALTPPPVTWAAHITTLPAPATLQKVAVTINAIFMEQVISQTSADPFVIADRRILIVEDNITNQMVTQGMLKSLGLTADIAENGQQAVEMCLRTSYDIIFMDCEMPVMDGYQASKIILGRAGSNQPAIIALTAQSMDAALERCRNAGMIAVLNKPITLTALKNCLADIPCPPAQE